MQTNGHHVPKRESPTEVEVNLGDVLLVGKQIGALRYVGPLYDPKTGQPWSDQYVGIELTEPTGGSDGTYGSRRYFTTEPGRGLFVRSSEVDRVLSAWELLKKVTEQHDAVRQILDRLNECLTQLQQSNERRLYLENELRRCQQDLSRAKVQAKHQSPAPITRERREHTTPVGNSIRANVPQTPAFTATATRLDHVAPEVESEILGLPKTAISLNVPERTPTPQKPKHNRNRSTRVAVHREPKHKSRHESHPPMNRQTFPQTPIKETHHQHMRTPQSASSMPSSGGRHPYRTPMTRGISPNHRGTPLQDRSPQIVTPMRGVVPVVPNRTVHFSTREAQSPFGPSMRPRRLANLMDDARPVELYSPEVSTDAHPVVEFSPVIKRSDSFRIRVPRAVRFGDESDNQSMSFSESPFDGASDIANVMYGHIQSPESPYFG